MRRTLRDMIDSESLLAATAPVAKKTPSSSEGDDGAMDQGIPMPMGPQELHIHLNQPVPDPSDTDQDDDDPSDDQQGDPSDDQQQVSPAAKNVAQTVQDPVGATQKGFSKLGKAKLAYDQAREETKRQLLPVQSVLQHVVQLHQLNDPMAGNPMGMQPNPDQQMGVDPQTGQPQNMNQQPGSQQMDNPQNARMGIGNGPNTVNNPRLNPRVPSTGSATQGAQTQVRPKKAGVPKPGQSKAGTRAGNPGKSIKLEVKSAADTRCQNNGRRHIEAGATLSNLRF